MKKLLIFISLSLLCSVIGFGQSYIVLGPAPSGASKVCADGITPYTYEVDLSGYSETYPSHCTTIRGYWDIKGGTPASPLFSGPGMQSNTVDVIWNTTATTRSIRYIIHEYINCSPDPVQEYYYASGTLAVSPSAEKKDLPVPVAISIKSEGSEVNQICAPQPVYLKVQSSETGNSFSDSIHGAFFNIYINNKFYRTIRDEQVDQSGQEYEVPGSVTIGSGPEEVVTSFRVHGGFYFLSCPNIRNSVEAQSPTINVYSKPNPSISHTDTSCPASEDGTITISNLRGNYYLSVTKNGSKSNAYSIGPIEFTGAPYILTKDSIPLGAGVYTIAASGRSIEEGYCMHRETVTIGAGPVTTLNAAVDREINCSGESTGRISFSSSTTTGNYTFTHKLYKWNGASFVYQEGKDKSSASGFFENLPAGTYQVEVTDERACTPAVKSDSLEIKEPAPLSFNIYPEPVLCHGESTGSIIISGVSGGVDGGTKEFSLSGPVNRGRQSSLEFTNLPKGTYTVSMYDVVNGITVCSTNDTEAIGQPDNPLSLSHSATNNKCKGDVNGAIDVTVQGGQPPYTYSWSTGSTSQDLFGLAEGDYTLIITDANRCTLSETITLRDPTLLQQSTSEGSIQHVAKYEESTGSISVPITGGVGSYTFTWYNADGSVYATQTDASSPAVLTELAGGTYQLMVTDANDCSTKKEPYEVRAPEAPLELKVTQQINVSCHGGSDGMVQLEASGGWHGYTYYINNEINGQEDNEFRDLRAADNYIFKVIDSYGVEFTLPAKEITEPATLEAEAVVTKHVSCYNGGDGVIGLSVSGGTSPYQYSADGGSSWQNLNGGESHELTGLKAGSYTIYIRDSNGCDFTLTNVGPVEQPEDIHIDVITNRKATCSKPNGSAEVAVSGGTPGYSFSWTDSDDVEISTDAKIENVYAGQYTITVTDGNKCTKSIKIPISNEGGAVLDTLSVQAVSCHGGSDGQAQLSVTGGIEPVSILWPDGQTGLEATGLSKGSHRVEARDGAGCISFLDVIVGEPAALGASVVLTDPGCYGASDGQLQATATGGTAPYTYLWSNGASGANQSGLAKGEYELTIIDANGCSFQQHYLLTDPAPLSFAFQGRYTICSGQWVELTTAYEGASYEWKGENGFLSKENKVSLQAPGHYELSLTTAEGCQGSTSFEIVVDDGLLKADFLMATEAYVGDTVVMIDISWPAPEAVLWQLPEGVLVVNQAGPYQEVVFTQVGTFHCALNATLAGCTAQYQHAITILDASKREEINEGQKKASFITLQASPNPTTGQVEVNLTFAESTKADLYVMGLVNQQVYIHHQVPETERIKKQLDLSALAPGIYLLYVKAGYHQQYLRAVKR